MQLLASKVLLQLRLLAQFYIQFNFDQNNMSWFSFYGYICSFLNNNQRFLTLQFRTRTVSGPDACGHGLSADVKFVDPHTSGTHGQLEVKAE